MIVKFNCIPANSTIYQHCPTLIANHLLIDYQTKERVKRILCAGRKPTGLEQITEFGEGSEANLQS